jgi:hypothetical protein|tara:strand:+ start:666 stop:899 length:234 start_codon:yes stop_codon:yes gene_type:complete
MKTLYQQLKPEIKSKINESATKYSTAKRLKYTLMAKRWWSDLTISELGDIISYGNIGTVDVSPHGYLYGNNIIEKED